MTILNDEIADKRFRKWLQTLPCCVCGQFAEYVNGEGRSHAAHVRHKSGIATKPLFQAVPLCYKHHEEQHRKGHNWFMSMEMWLKLADTYYKKWLNHENRNT
jgi:hypothetical protein